MLLASFAVARSTSPGRRPPEPQVRLSPLAVPSVALHPLGRATFRLARHTHLPRPYRLPRRTPLAAPHPGEPRGCG